MEVTEDIIKLAKKLRNKKAKEWRDKNKEKVKAINQRYWIKRAKEFKEKQIVKESTKGE